MIDKSIKDFSPRELQLHIESRGEKQYRARQIAEWVYQKGARSFDDMTNLSKELRRDLKSRFPVFDSIKLCDEKISTDGTRKYLFELEDGNRIESVLIPDDSRNTLCISSQVGCALGCKFCLTATLGKLRNLRTSEIIDQYLKVSSHSGQRITNIVFMGMGEPLDNINNLVSAIEILTNENFIGMSKKRITVSTSGLVPGINKLSERLTVNLSVSLNAPNDSIRDEIMPVNRRFPIKQLLESVKDFPLPKRKDLTFEYVLLSGVNDATGHAHELGRMLCKLRCKVNLIPFNEAYPLDYKTPAESDVLNFQSILETYGINTKIRKNRGRDILGACGQLAADYSRSTAH